LHFSSSFRAVSVAFDENTAINCSPETKSAVSYTGEGGQDGHGICWANQTVNCSSKARRVEWKFTVLEGQDIFFGLSVAPDKVKSLDPQMTEDMWLCHGSTGSLYHKGNLYCSSDDIVISDCSFAPGDVITFSVDCNERTVKVGKNNEGMRTAFANIPPNCDLYPAVVFAKTGAVQISGMGKVERCDLSNDEYAPPDLTDLPNSEAVAQSAVEMVRYLYERSPVWSEVIERMMVETLASPELSARVERLAANGVLSKVFGKGDKMLVDPVAREVDAVAAKVLPALAIIADIDRGIKVGSKVLSNDGTEGIVTKCSELHYSSSSYTSVHVFWTGESSALQTPLSKIKLAPTEFEFNFQCLLVGGHGNLLELLYSLNQGQNWPTLSTCRVWTLFSTEIQILLA
jgi:hypothetical protein